MNMLSHAELRWMAPVRVAPGLAVEPRPAQAGGDDESVVDVEACPVALVPVRPSVKPEAEPKTPAPVRTDREVVPSVYNRQAVARVAQLARPRASQPGSLIDLYA